MSSKRYLEAFRVEAVKETVAITAAESALSSEVFQQNPAVAELTPHGTVIARHLNGQWAQRAASRLLFL